MMHAIIYLLLTCVDIETKVVVAGHYISHIANNLLLLLRCGVEIVLLCVRH